MRIFVAGFQHETNTFARRPAKWEDFERGDFFPPFVRGEEMLRCFIGGTFPMSGFLTAALGDHCEVLPSCWAGASPSAAVEHEAFERVRAAIREDLINAIASGPIDGIYLDLHGAAVCDHVDAPETELLELVRSVAGAHLPLVASLDLHANVDRRMLEAADYLVAYRTYPHIDMIETGEAAFQLLKRRHRLGRKEAFVLRRLPFLLPTISQSTLQEPAASTYRIMSDLARRSDTSASFAPGFPAADIARCGASVWAYGPDAGSIVDTVVSYAVDRRALWAPRLLRADLAVAEAIRLAQEHEGPVVIADVQDNPGAGADGSTTGLLHALVQAGAGRLWPGRVAFGLLNDPLAAAVAHAVPIGTSTRIRLGAAVNTWNGISEPPLEAVAVVRAISDGQTTLEGPMMKGAKVRAGRSACLDVDGIQVAVASTRTQTLDRALFQMVDIEPAHMKIIVVKSAVHFRADFDSVASAIILAKSPGPMAADPADLVWTRLEKDISPAV